MDAPPNEVASQSETFSKLVAKQRVNQIVKGMALAATTAKSFLLTGRLYWLLSRIHILSPFSPI